jgi:hypothetical protein
METLGVNPLEESVQEQMKTGRQQYAALLEYAQDSNGLRSKVEADRAGELTAYEHHAAARVGLKTVHLLSLGLYRHREQERGAEAIVALDRLRRATRPAAPAAKPEVLIYAEGN